MYSRDEQRQYKKHQLKEKKLNRQYNAIVEKQEEKRSQYNPPIWKTNISTARKYNLDSQGNPTPSVFNKASSRKRTQKNYTTYQRYIALCNESI